MRYSRWPRRNTRPTGSGNRLRPSRLTTSRHQMLGPVSGWVSNRWMPTRPRTPSVRTQLGRLSSVGEAGHGCHYGGIAFVRYSGLLAPFRARFATLLVRRLWADGAGEDGVHR